MKFKVGLMTAMLLVTGTALADDNGFYAGAGVGWSSASLPKSKITNTIAYAFDAAGAPLETWSAKTDESTIMWSAFAGYRFLEYFAVEAGYLDTGTVSYTGNGTADLIGVGTIQAKATLDWQSTGWPVSVLGIWPVDETWSVFGRAGAYFGDVKDDLHIQLSSGTTSSGGKDHISKSTTEFIGGVGVDAKFMEQWAARFEWLTIPSLGNNDTGDADWNAFQFSLLYKF
jgi:OOP family OmpA-OmpF porin